MQQAYPFAVAPDAFTLELPKDTQDLTFDFFEMPWGLTDEHLCYYRGLLIGRVHVKSRPSQPRCADGRVVIALLPQLERTRGYSWPSAQTFANAMVDLLHNTQIWVLHCEYDADQHPLERIQDNIPRTLERLHQTLAYCAAESSACPSFSSTVSDNGSSAPVVPTTLFERQHPT